MDIQLRRFFMLTQLTIHNFAIVRQLEIELAKGMSVIEILYKKTEVSYHQKERKE